jgi:hypothetical protein
MKMMMTAKSKTTLSNPIKLTMRRFSSMINLA